MSFRPAAQGNSSNFSRLLDYLLVPAHQQLPHSPAPPGLLVKDRDLLETGMEITPIISMDVGSSLGRFCRKPKCEVAALAGRTKAPLLHKLHLISFIASRVP